MSSSSSSIETEKLKIQKKFSRRIIHEASNANYEPHEIGSLIDIILTSLNLETEEEVFSFILKCRIHDPLVISSITKIELNSVQLIDLMLLEGKNRFLINIEEAFEQGLLSLKDQDTREHVR